MSDESYYLFPVLFGWRLFHTCFRINFKRSASDLLRTIKNHSNLTSRRKSEEKKQCYISILVFKNLRLTVNYGLKLWYYVYRLLSFKSYYLFVKDIWFDKIDNHLKLIVLLTIDFVSDIHNSYEIYFLDLDQRVSD